MTAKQKANRERFKKVVAEAKKLRKKNPKLTQAQAVKQAWAISYGKAGKGKKLGEYHKDTKSHNVNIRVVSGLPPSFRGTFGPVKFRIVKQYDIYGKINAVLEDINTKTNFLTIDGTENATKLAEQFHKYIVKNDKDFDNADMKKETVRRMTKFFTQLNKDVKEENKKNKTSNPGKPKKKAAKKQITKSQSGSTNIAYDRRKQALKPGKRKSASGRTYYEYRANRSDKGVLLGVQNDFVTRNVNAYKKLQAEIKDWEKKYKQAKDPGIKYLYKLKLDRLKFEAKERKFVIANYIKQLKKVK